MVLDLEVRQCDGTSGDMWGVGGCKLDVLHKG